jgi:hypothetical protein
MSKSLQIDDEITGPYFKTIWSEGHAMNSSIPNLSCM